MKVLGIDIALNNTGYAVLERNGSRISCITHGTLKNKQTEEFAIKLANIHNFISDIIAQYSPSLCGIEETFLNVNPASSLKLGAARGAAFSAIGKCKLPVFDIKPNTIKKTVTGAGKAEKQQVAFMVRRLVSGIADSATEDETDAVAVAFTAMFL